MVNRVSKLSSISKSTIVQLPIVVDLPLLLSIAFTSGLYTYGAWRAPKVIKGLAEAFKVKARKLIILGLFSC